MPESVALSTISKFTSTRAALLGRFFYNFVTRLRVFDHLAELDKANDLPKSSIFPVGGLSTLGPDLSKSATSHCRQPKNRFSRPHFRVIV